MDRIEAVARAIVASDYAESPHLGELTDERWQEMLGHWKSLEAEPELRSGHRVDDAIRRARAALDAAAPPGDALELTTAEAEEWLERLDSCSETLFGWRGIGLKALRDWQRMRAAAPPGDAVERAAQAMVAEVSRQGRLTPLGMVDGDVDFDALARAVLAAVGWHGWRPIETAPKDGTLVDLWVCDGSVGDRLADCQWLGGKWFWRYPTASEVSSTPTHWQPLPPPPPSEPEHFVRIESPYASLQHMSDEADRLMREAVALKPEHLAIDQPANPRDEALAADSPRRLAQRMLGEHVPHGARIVDLIREMCLADIRPETRAVLEKALEEQWFRRAIQRIAVSDEQALPDEDA